MNILIVEDEAMAAGMLKSMLAGILGGDAVSIQWKATLGGSECFLWERPIDLLFLDLDLRGQDGFELLKNATAGSFHTVIVSAHTERALEAFEYGALDFIPKPATEERLRKALERCTGGLPQRSLKRLCVAHGGTVHIVPIEEVSYIEASEKASKIHLRDGGTEMCRKNLGDLEKILPENFIRIHRSYLVDMAEIRGLASSPGRRHFASLRNGASLPVGRDAYPLLKKRMGAD